MACSNVGDRGAITLRVDACSPSLFHVIYGSRLSHWQAHLHLKPLHEQRLVQTTCTSSSSPHVWACERKFLPAGSKALTDSRRRRTTCCQALRSSSIRTGLIRKSTAPCVTPRSTTFVSPFDDITAQESQRAAVRAVHLQRKRAGSHNLAACTHAHMQRFADGVCSIDASTCHSVVTDQCQERRKCAH